MALPTYGSMAVDWENRVDFDRLRRDRLARAKDLLKKSEMGALLCFDMNNVRYLTATHIGTWAQFHLPDGVRMFARSLARWRKRPHSDGAVRTGTDHRTADR